MASKFLLLAGALALVGIAYYLYTTYPNMPSVELKEEGYKVSALVNLSEQNAPIDIYRDGRLVKSVQSQGNVFVEYLPPGSYEYAIQFSAANLLGMQTRMSQSAQLNIEKLESPELAKYFDFPQASLSTSKYAVYLSYPNLKSFEEAVVYRNGQPVKSINAKSASGEFVENAPPAHYSYEIAFNSQQYQSLKGVLRQDYELDVEPITPAINSLAISPLYKGYSANASAEVENASSCKAELLLSPPAGFEAAPSTVLKGHNFSNGNGLDYFYKKSESWSWDSVLFNEPTDTNTANYDINVKMTCYDFYNATQSEKIQKLPTSGEISPSSISISYSQNESGNINAMVTNNVWIDFTCRLLVGDQANNILEEKKFPLPGHHDYEFGLDKYSRNLLYLTAICQDSNRNPITKISTFKN